PIVVLEPSCCAVFRDELQGLFPERGDARLLGEQVVTLAELLTSGGVRARGWSPPQMDAKAIVQGHCHQKAIMKMDAEREILESMGLGVEVLEAGCCGMAGAFGYEKDTYAVSVAAGERALLPRVRDAAATTLVLANGFSCRSQIEQLTTRGALHLAEVLKLAKDGWDGSAYPERPARRDTEVGTIPPGIGPRPLA
ncbi:MAG: FAD-binding oxidoreductase, partial [Polyangiaceae bacterium]